MNVFRVAGVEIDVNYNWHYVSEVCGCDMSFIFYGWSIGRAWSLLRYHNSSLDIVLIHLHSFDLRWIQLIRPTLTAFLKPTGE